MKNYECLTAKINNDLFLLILRDYNEFHNNLKNNKSNRFAIRVGVISINNKSVSNFRRSDLKLLMAVIKAAE